MDGAQVSTTQSSKSLKRPGHKPRGRPRAQLACSACRLRKVKCNFITAENNVCSACVTSKVPCIIVGKNNRRSNTDEEIATLRKRLVDLESILEKDARRNLSLPGMPDTHPQNVESITLNHSPPSFLARTESTKSAQPRASETSRQQHEPVFEAQIQPTWLASTTTDVASAENAITTRQPTMVNELQFAYPTPVVPLVPTGTVVGLEPEIVNDWPIAENNENCRPRFFIDPRRMGPPGFFGPTSNWHLHSYGLIPESTDGNDSLADEDANVTVETDSLHVRRAILDIFWTSNELWSNIVDKDQFLASKAGGKASEYYSPSLEDAMLACGSRNSTSSAIRKAGRIYVNRAKEGLLTQVETPSIAAIQKLLLVSNFEAGDGYHRIGWTYYGIALQMLFDLGIHEDCSVLVAQGHLSIREAACRRRLLLSAFLYDTIWAWFIGRPRSIPLSSITMVYSKNNEDLQCDTSALILDAWVNLCILMAEAGDILNLSVSLDDFTVERLSQLYTSIDRLLETLPDDLAWHSSEMSPLHPSAYGLHTQISAFKMLLLRLPSRSRHPMHSFDIVEKNRVTLNGFTLETSDAVIYENAVRIVRLVHLLVQVHGIEQIVPTILDNTYIAAIILIQHMSNAQQLRTQESLKAVENDKGLLDILAKTLAGAEKHYSMTAVLRKNLCSKIREMHLTGLFRSDNNDEENVTDQSTSVSSEPVPDQHQHPSDVDNPILASEHHFLNSAAFEFSPSLMTSIEQYQGATTDTFPWPLSPVG